MRDFIIERQDRDIRIRLVNGGEDYADVRECSKNGEETARGIRLTPAEARQMLRILNENYSATQ